MPTKRQEELLAMRQELARYNERWARAKDALAALGDRVLVVPIESLQRIDAACAPHVERTLSPILRA